MTINKVPLNFSSLWHQIEFSDVLAEPASTQSYDRVWVYSGIGFESARLWGYRCLTALCALPLSCLCGCLFALLACMHIWYAHFGDYLWNLLHKWNSTFYSKVLSLATGVWCPVFRCFIAACPVWGHCGWVWSISSSLRSALLWLAVAVAYMWCSPKNDETQGGIWRSLSNCFSLNYKTWIIGIPAEWIFCYLKLCWNNYPLLWDIQRRGLPVIK